MSTTQYPRPHEPSIKSAQNTLFDPLDQLFNLPWKALADSAFGRGRETAFIPTISLASSEHQYTVTAELSGVDKKDVSLEVHDHVLTISGEKKKEVHEKTHTYHLDERSFGSFQRAIHLPDDADEEHIQAKQDNGLLEITIPRLTHTTRKVSIA